MGNWLSAAGQFLTGIVHFLDILSNAKYITLNRFVIGERTLRLERFAQRTIDRLDDVGVLSITFDNGREFAGHLDVEAGRGAWPLNPPRQ